MAEFLDTTATSYHIERLLKGAREHIVLISPYLKLRPRIRELIEDATRLKLGIHIVYGKKERCRETERLRALSGVQVTFCKNVHAKCYLNERFGIITSLNLYDFSEAKNQEMGVFFERGRDTQLYRQAYDEAQRIIRISEGSPALQSEAGAITPSMTMDSAATYGKLTTAKLAEKLGLRTTELFKTLVGRGYLEFRDGDKHYITSQGREVGGEFRMGKGPYFLWPRDLKV